MTQPQQVQAKSMKPFFVLFSGQAVSLFGSQLVQFSLIWWLTQTTGSATTLAMASLVGMLPQVLLGPFVGVLVDRWNRRLTMLAADSIVALASLGLAYLFWSEQVQIGHVFIILFVRALGSGFHWPAMQSSTSLMVPEAQLTRIQGLNQTLQGGMNIFSAPLGAVLLGVIAIQGILMIDVVTALFAIIPLLFIAVPQPKSETVSQTDRVAKPSFWEDMGAGLRYVWGWSALLLLMGLAAVINFVLTPTFSLMPLLVTNHFGGGALQLGFLEAAFGVGIVSGGLLLSVWGGFKRRIITSLLGMLGMGMGTLFMGFAPANGFFLAVVGGFLIGVMIPLVNGSLTAIFQTSVAPEMQGRFFTLFRSMATGMSPLGLVIAGPVADTLGVRSWYIVGGFVTLLLGIVGLMLPALLRIEDDRSGSEPRVVERAA